ncbi:DinB superfamily protein [Granulicella pectinivorans]|jgi:uncharacterized damage-inducible protein DinB|uniref:DinB superfamily protein n=1 Tax=Granulicella pectinivorans TaxID=474950 RepID=A0A1I6LND9_9BACT|nr:DinB family protein [Granulicella pectinivorans]SFS05037.1 DinB superfamily protein [Granulicella pectinivorans]
MQQNVTELVPLLARTPKALDALLRGLPETWTHRNEGDGSWNVFDVLGHMAHCERHDWMPRARIILEAGETVPFPPLDRTAHFRASEGKTLEELLDQFAALRAESLVGLKAINLTEAQLELKGQHPAFGVVTLGELLTTWAVHDLTHLHQISRVMAYQQRENVGPWSAYLGVLKKG